MGVFFMKKFFSAVLTAVLVLCSCFITGDLRAGAVSAKAYILINAETGSVIEQSNSDMRLPMASTTKIMTAWLLAEQNTPDKTVTVTKEMVTVEGSSMGLLPGDTVSYHDLLYGMLLASGNDAANVTAYCLAGSPEKFAVMMNQKAKEIGLKNTNFVTPSGLDDDNHYTTAADLAELARRAMQNPEFKKAASTKSAQLYYGNPPYKRWLTNHNKLLSSFPGAIGVKTGFTKKSGRCLVSAAERDGGCVIAVTLNDPNDWADHAALLERGLSQLYKYTPDLSMIDDTLPVIGASDTDRVRIKIPNIEMSLTKKEDKEFTYKVDCQKFLYAPLKAGSEVGTITFYLNGKQVGTYPITVETAVSAAAVDRTEQFIKCLMLLLNM